MPDRWAQYEVKSTPKADRWAQYEVKSAPTGVAGLPSGVDLPSVPQPNALATVKDVPPLVGGVGATVANVGTHLKNLVAGPYHAFTDTPKDETEMAIAANPSGGSAALGAYRLAAKPTVDAIRQSRELRAKGGAQASLWDGSTYDAQGNNVPTAGSKLVDAIPVIGPWARNFKDEQEQEGMAPAVAGFLTDVFGPKLVAKAAAPVLSVAGKTARVAGASVPSLKAVGTRVLAPGSAGEVMARGLKPSVTYGAGVPTMIEDALPDILKQNPSPRTVGEFGQAADAARDANQQEYQSKVSPYESGRGITARPSAIDGNKVFQAQMDSVPFIEDFENPSASSSNNWWSGPSAKASSKGILDATAEKAKPYRKTMDLPTADRLREGANAKLESFYNRARGNRAAALADPETARYKAVGDSLREQIYPIIDNDYGLTPGSTASQRQMFGKLSNVADIANRRDIVVGRHDPVTLAEKVATGHGGPVATAFNFMKERALRGMTDSDALVRSGIDRFNNPGGAMSSLRPSNGIHGRILTATGSLAEDAANGLRYISPLGLRYRSPMSPVITVSSSMRPSKKAGDRR